jgi:transcriptional regulator with PAS, ATPase and Fis domain
MNEAWKFMAASEPRRRALALVQRAAKIDCAVLILGPTGVGKDVLAEDIHRHSRRAEQPFVAINCAAITPTLFESELFGHVRGAYTSATAPKAGLVELAAGGTLFLDEVGELPLEAQAKLLRFVERGVYWPVGATRERYADVRLIAATNRDLPALAAGSGHFRADLYFRLSVVTVVVPPLEPADIALLTRTLIDELAARHQKRFVISDVETLVDLAAQREWPGGVRELRNAIERCLLLREPGESVADVWPIFLPAAPPPPTAALPEATGELANLDAIIDALGDLLFLMAARETGDVRKLAHRIDRSLQATYDRLRRLQIEPRELRDAARMDHALAAARRRLTPHLPRIQALLKT